MKNLIFMQNININRKETGMGHLHGRGWTEKNTPYRYSISSWKKWAENNNCDVLLMEDLLTSTEQMGICWQRYYIFDMLENNGVLENYNQFLIVDADTIVHPDCPNFFELTEGKYTGVNVEGSMDWVGRSMEQFSKLVFKDSMVSCTLFSNGEVQIFNKSHRKFLKQVIDYYFDNKDSLQHVTNTYGIGTDQTPMNFLLRMHDIDVKLLPYEFNMQDMFRKEILDEQLTFTKLGWIYHYCAIPNNHNQEQTLYWMRKTYEHFYGELSD